MYLWCLNDELISMIEYLSGGACNNVNVAVCKAKGVGVCISMISRLPYSISQPSSSPTNYVLHSSIHKINLSIVNSLCESSLIMGF